MQTHFVTCFETQFEFLRNYLLKQNLGFIDYTDSPIIYIQEVSGTKKIIGSLPEFQKYIIKEFNYHDTLKTEDFEVETKTELKNFLDTNGNKYVYFKFNIEGDEDNEKNKVVLELFNKNLPLTCDNFYKLCLGAKNEEDSRKSAKIFAHNIKNLGYENVKFKKFQLINIVATCDLKFPIKLTKLSLKLSVMPKKIQSENNDDKKSCFYNPETFPGLIYHMRAPEITLLIFKSGKVNFVGAKNNEDIFKALKKIYPLLCKYKNKLEMNNNKVEEDNVVDFSDINNL
jgi:TATA-box binding protein (TBP) (component of TFIID and TFIIIB)